MGNLKGGGGATRALPPTGPLGSMDPGGLEWPSGGRGNLVSRRSCRHAGMPTLGCHGWAGCSAARAPTALAAAVPRWLKDTGMPWLGQRRRGSSLGFCRQPRRSVFGSRTLGCQSRTVVWLKQNVCGLVSTRSGVKPPVVAKNIVCVCVCVRHVCPSARALSERESAIWGGSCVSLTH